MFLLDGESDLRSSSEASGTVERFAKSFVFGSCLGGGGGEIDTGHKSGEIGRVREIVGKVRKASEFGVRTNNFFIS